MKPKLQSTYTKSATQEMDKNETELLKNNIDPILARKLSHNKIKLYSLENKIKIILFNSKLILI